MPAIVHGMRLAALLERSGGKVPDVSTRLTITRSKATATGKRNIRYSLELGWSGRGMASRPNSHASIAIGLATIQRVAP